MNVETPLDRAHAKMSGAPEDDEWRLRFFERLGDAELFVMLEAEAEGDTIAPLLFDTGTGNGVIVFDTEARLAQFAGGVAPFAAMSGRALAHLLAEQGLGLALNPEVAPSTFVLAPDGVAWLAETLAQAPEEVTGDIAEVLAPKGLPDALIEGLTQKLAMTGDFADVAYLAATRSRAGASGHILAFIGAVPGSEPALAKAVAEALTFSGVESGVLDVGFFRTDDPIAAHLARVAVRFDLPRAETRTAAPGNGPAEGPGMDPSRPPILR